MLPSIAGEKNHLKDYFGHPVIDVTAKREREREKERERERERVRGEEKYERIDRDISS